MARAQSSSGLRERIHAIRRFYGCQGRSGHMRAQDRQFQQNLVAGVMDKPGAPGVPFDVEGSGYGFRIVRDIPASQAEMSATCAMQRPWQ